MKRNMFFAAAMALTFGLLAGCSAAPDHMAGGNAGGSAQMPEAGIFSPSLPDVSEGNPGYHYDGVVEQGWSETAWSPSAYFSLDRNTANYSQVRALINNGAKVTSDSVRIEELINYFSYGFPAPEEGELMSANAYLSDCPWNDGSKLVTVGIRTAERKLDAGRNNYVFLIDISGSMSARVSGLEGVTCLDLVKYGIDKLVGGLSASDAVSVVTYASGVGTALEPTLCDEAGKTAVHAAVEKLNASGATNGAGGLELAYRCAETYKAEGGNNRVILMTDGDFNVGMHDTESLKTFIADRAKSGVYLSVIGVGMGNMRDDLMQTLALNGNGNYAYIDTPREAEKTLEEELGGMLVPVAKDAKAGVTFDADSVERYRLIGYDMKHMSGEEFDDPEKDAGEIGSNLTVVAVYEVVLRETAEEGATLADVTLRFQSAADGAAQEIARTVRNTPDERDDLRFIACVAEFGLVLRNSEFKGGATLADVLSRLDGMREYLSADVYKEEFRDLVERAASSGYYGS